MKNQEESHEKYKAFPFKSKKDIPKLPLWLCPDPEAKKRMDKKRNEKNKHT